MKTPFRLFHLGTLSLALYVLAYCACKRSLKLIGRDLHPPEPSFLASLFFPARAVERQCDLWRTQLSYSGVWKANDGSGITARVRFPSFDICVLTIHDPKKGFEEPLFRDMRHPLYRSDDIVLIDTASERYLLFGRSGGPFQLFNANPLKIPGANVMFVKR